MTQEQLYEQCLVLPADAQITFIEQHNLNWGEFWCYRQSHKPQRSKKKQRQSALAEQGGNCALCEVAIGYYDSLRLDRQTGKVFCPGCQLVIARLRNMAAIGVTAERVAAFVPEFFAPAPVPAPGQAPAPALSQAPDLIDPFDPYAP
jgi:hypothetical protein